MNISLSFSKYFFMGRIVSLHLEVMKVFKFSIVKMFHFLLVIWNKHVYSKITFLRFIDEDKTTQINCVKGQKKIKVQIFFLIKD